MFGSLESRPVVPRVIRQRGLLFGLVAAGSILAEACLGRNQDPAVQVTDAAIRALLNRDEQGFMSQIAPDKQTRASEKRPGIGVSVSSLNEWAACKDIARNYSEYNADLGGKMVVVEFAKGCLPNQVSLVNFRVDQVSGKWLITSIKY